MPERSFPEALPHGRIEELFPDIFFVTGTMKISGRLPMRFSRNMVIVRQGSELTLINSVRLDDAGLEELDALGKVSNVIRLAGFHGMDDPFYGSHYGAKVWALESQPYASGLSRHPKPEDIYFTPDVIVTENSPLPITDAKLICLSSARPGEALLLLERDGGILIVGDCLQNWTKPDAFFSLPAKLMMRALGFIAPYNVGPGWIKSAKPDPKEVRGILDLPFDCVLPAHGGPVLSKAKQSFRKAIEKFGSPA